MRPLVFWFCSIVWVCSDPVLFKRARFSVLSDIMVRMEHSPTTTFDDRPTLQVVNRQLPAVTYTVSYPTSTSVQIKTSSLTLNYEDDGTSSKTCQAPMQDTDATGGQRVPAYPDGVHVSSQAECCSLCTKDPDCTSFVLATQELQCWLLMGVTGTFTTTDRSITFLQGAFQGRLSIDAATPDGTIHWKAGDVQKGNLLGTYEALDCYVDAVNCSKTYRDSMSPGLLATDGWTVLDDTATTRLIDGNWTWWDEQQTFPDDVDWYFVAYGKDYRTALASFASILGGTALPPRSAFGIWWSRYYTYSEASVVSEVLAGYASNNIPLNHLILDMDWHCEPTDKTCDPWGGYDWNTTLFPDTTNFINWLHSYNNTVGRPLKLGLNLHPQSGIDHCQQRYTAFATAMGIDPKSNKSVECDFGNLKFVQTLYDLYLDAAPSTGVDFWWADYGGCGGPPNWPLLWNNYVMVSHIEVARKKRGLVLSRNGKLGNHRYPIGFSGDTQQHEMMLDWEIFSTPLAANVLFGYWSHDIGGFWGTGASDPTNITASELFLRWVQFGSVSPMFRTHCNHCERRIWEFPFHFPQLRDAFRFRSALVPYLYSEGFKAFETGVSIVHPVWYDYSSAEAFSFDHQYMLGSDVLAAPVSSFVDKTNKTNKTVWIPGDTWLSWDGQTKYTGSSTVDLRVGLDEIPLFVRAGAVLPFQTPATDSNSPDLEWVVFGGLDEGDGVVYEDDGESVLSANGLKMAQSFALTNAHFDVSQGVTFVVEPAFGKFPGMKTSRQVSVQFRGFFKQAPASVIVNGNPIPHGPGVPGWFVNDVSSLTRPLGVLVVNVGSQSTSGKTVVMVR